MRRILLLTGLVLVVMAGCGGSDDAASTTTALETDTTVAPEDAPSVLALGEERVLADLLALGIRPVASTANVVIDGGFVGLDAFDTTGIEALVSTEPNLEYLASFDVDVVVASEFVVDYLGPDVLEGLGEVVVVEDGDPRDQVLGLGDAFDKQAEAAALVAELDAAIEIGRESLASLPEDLRTVSVATVYPGPSVAAWVDGPVDIPDTLLDLGFTLRPSADEVVGAEGGRVYLSEEQLGLFDAPTIVAMQTEWVDGEAEAIEDIAQDPLWSDLPAVTGDRVVTVDRLGYPGIAGRIRLVEDLVDGLGA